MSAPQSTANRARADVKPSGRQVFKIAALTLEALGLEFPASSADASQIIGKLLELHAAKPAVATSDDCPF